MGASQSSSKESDTSQILLENSDNGETKITKRRLSVDELNQLSKELKSATDNNVTLDVDLYKSIGSDLGIEFEEDTDDEEEYEDDDEGEYEVFEVTELIDPIQVPIELNETPLSSQIAPAIELPPPVFVNESAGLEIGPLENSPEKEHEIPEDVGVENSSVTSEALVRSVEITRSDADDVQSSNKVEQEVSDVVTTVEETTETEVEIVKEEQTVMENEELGEADVEILSQETSVIESHVEESFSAEQVIDKVVLEETVGEELQIVKVCEDLPKEEEESIVPVTEIAREPTIEADEEVTEASSGVPALYGEQDLSSEVVEVIHEANEDDTRERSESSLTQAAEDLSSSEDFVEHVEETVSREPEQIVEVTTNKIAKEIVSEEESMPEEMLPAVDDKPIPYVPSETTPGDICEVTEESCSEIVTQEVVETQISESEPIDIHSETATEVELDDVEKVITEHIPEEALESDIHGDAVTEVCLEDEVPSSKLPFSSSEGAETSEDVVSQADLDVVSVEPIVDEAVVEREEMEITPVFESIVEVIESAIEDVMELVPANKSEADNSTDTATETPEATEDSPEIVTDQPVIEQEQVEQPVMEIAEPDEPVTESVSEVFSEPVINEVIKQPTSESQSDFPELVHGETPIIAEEFPDVFPDNIPEPVLNPVGEADSGAGAEIAAELVDEKPIVEAIVKPVIEAVVESPVEKVVEPVMELAAEQEATEPVVEPISEQVSEPVVKSPVEEPVVEAPVEEPAVEAPVEETVVEAPVEEPVVEAPVEEPVVEAPVEEPVVELTPEPAVELTPETEVETVKEEEGGTSIFSIIQQAIEPYFTSKPDEKEIVIPEESETEVEAPCETDTLLDAETPETSPETTLPQPAEVVEIIESPPVVEKVPDVVKEAVVANELPTRKDLAESLFGQFQKQEVEKIITEAKLEGARSQANLDADVMSSTLNAERSRWRGRFSVIEENLKRRKEDISSAHEQGIATVTSKLDLPETKESCTDSVKAITDCYLSNPTEVLRCNSLTQSFDACVSSSLAQR